LGAALRRVFERLPEGGRGLTGSIVEPIAKGAGVLVSADGDETRVEPIG
jgi:hypothetical protein